MWFQRVAGSPPGYKLQYFFLLETDNFPCFFDSAIFTSRVVAIAQLSVAGYKYHNLIFVTKTNGCHLG